jgi:hypothetical protein
MATINNPDLTVTTNRPVDRASVIATCDVEFTDVEVNAMNMLGLQYTLTCQVINKELLDEDPVITFRQVTLPREIGQASRTDHVVFASDEAMESLHDRLIGKDKLVAKLTLTNQETHADVSARTEQIAVDLAA